ncbi:FecR family protein [Methylophilus aquaticus]|uniref:FecR domain-containing protein n=1 Tax=Methylophilus aquaticus TaxID=1971610 RepID=A0ABT9JUR0_9PROT|nr:FecR domain-containing protein [Methylophilus aquaticus]MDP8568322.1 FecR domain-containing protein [Methylophilus aquaticus]
MKNKHTALHVQAAEWIVKLTADDPDERAQARAALAQLTLENTQQAEATARLERFINLAERVSASAPSSAEPAQAGQQPAIVANTLRQYLHLHQQSRSLAKIRKPLMLWLLMLLPAWGLMQTAPLAVLFADVRTTAGVYDNQQLKDGSQIRLNPSTALNVHFTASQREIELLAGEVYLDVAKDKQRPFVIHTRQGQIQALGTRFIVRVTPDDTLLTMLESRTQVTPGWPTLKTLAAPQVVSAGQMVRFSADKLSNLPDIHAGMTESAFKQHRLVVQNTPLSEVLETLQQHRPGVILYDAKAMKQILVTAVLPLDDTDRALDLLCENFTSLTVSQYSRFFVTVNIQH